MEFDAVVSGDNYRFSSLSQTSFLVSGPKAEYILYNRNQHWHCADEIEKDLLQKLSGVLEDRLQPVH